MSTLRAVIAGRAAASTGASGLGASAEGREGPEAGDSGRVVGERTPLLGSSTGLQEDEEEIKVLTSSSPQQGSTWYISVVLMVNAALGAGLLDFPLAYEQSGGILVAVIVQAVLIFFVVVSILALVYCAQKHQTASYQDTMLAVLGKPLQMTCSATIAVYCFGTCITFFIIIGDQWDKFLTFIYGAEYCNHWYMNRSFTMVATSIVCVLPVCFPRRIDFLKYVSVVGVLAVVYVMLLVMVKYFVGPINPGPIKTRPDNWTDVFMVVPVICFSYQCHVSVIPIFSCMKIRTVHEFSKTMTVALLLCVLAYTGTASFGYLAFGSDVNADILLSYKPISPDVLVGVIVVAVKMYTTYPILLFVGRSALDSVMTYMLRMTPEAVCAGERRRRIITTLVWFTVTLLLAVVVPDISIVISLLGGLAAIFIFIFPGLCLLQLSVKPREQSSDPIHRWSTSLRVTAVLFIVIGVFIFGEVTTKSIYHIVNGSNKSHNLREIICP